MKSHVYVGTSMHLHVHVSCVLAPSPVALQANRNGEMERCPSTRSSGGVCHFCFYASYRHICLDWVCCVSVEARVVACIGGKRVTARSVLARSVPRAFPFEEFPFSCDVNIYLACSVCLEKMLCGPS